MSLRHAVLAAITARPMTGYDLVKYFDGSVAFVWHAPHSQIYPELRRMEADGLIESEVVPRGDRAEKRQYTVSEKGLAELRAWATKPLSYPPVRDPYRLRAAFFEWSTYAAARRQLAEHRNHYQQAAGIWERLIDDINAVQVPILRARVAGRPEDEHAAIVAFKAFAFRGERNMARCEVEWAEEGLALLDDLEAQGVPLVGERDE